MTEVAGPPRKGPAAFRTISEASAEVGVPQHVLRFWETRFAFVRPMKRAGGRRFYRPQDLDVLRGVRALLQEEGYTIKGVQKLHREQGLKRLVTASGIGEAAAALAAAEVEGEVEAGASVEDAPAQVRGAVRSVAADPDEEPEGDQTADLFADALHTAPDPAQQPPPASRPVLDSDARRRLAEVLSDLETTKAGIDALLQEP